MLLKQSLLSLTFIFLDGLQTFTLPEISFLVATFGTSDLDAARPRLDASFHRYRYDRWLYVVTPRLFWPLVVLLCCLAPLVRQLGRSWLNLGPSQSHLPSVLHLFVLHVLTQPWTMLHLFCLAPLVNFVYCQLQEALNLTFTSNTELKRLWRVRQQAARVVFPDIVNTPLSLFHHSFLRPYELRLYLSTMERMLCACEVPPPDPEIMKALLLWDDWENEPGVQVDGYSIRLVIDVAFPDRDIYLRPASPRRNKPGALKAYRACSFTTRHILRCFLNVALAQFRQLRKAKAPIVFDICPVMDWSTLR